MLQQSTVTYMKMYTLNYVPSATLIQSLPLFYHLITSISDLIQSLLQMLLPLLLIINEN